MEAFICRVKKKASISADPRVVNLAGQKVEIDAANIVKIEAINDFGLHIKGMDGVVICSRFLVPESIEAKNLFKQLFA